MIARSSLADRLALAFVPALALALLPACGGAPTAPRQPPPPYASPTPLREARLFAPGVVSTEPPEFSLSFEPDGKTAYFNRTSPDRKQLVIHVARWSGERWIAEVAPFSGTHRDIDPFVTHDGRRLYFSSDRPRPGAPERTDLDLWYVERAAASGPWSEPRHVEGSPNDAEDIGFVSIDRAGAIYFDAFRGKVRSSFRAAPKAGGGWAEPEPFGPSDATNPLIAPDGGFVVFSAKITGNFGESDLYISRRETGGTWSEPRNLGAAVNTARAEFAPGLSPDGLYLFFTSERPGVMPAPAEGRPPGDIYQIEVSALPF
jgi:hypothetical protein